MHLSGSLWLVNAFINSDATLSWKLDFLVAEFFSFFISSGCFLGLES